MKQEPQVILCPYCGHVQVVADNAAVPDQCEECRGLFEPLSRRATQISMGPWYIRDKKNPFRPGASFEVISKMARNGRIKPTTVLRGPSTKQFWSVARNVPGIAHLLGYCHKCNGKVKPDDKVCGACGEKFDEPKERNELGLAYRTAAEAASAQKALEKEIAQLTGKSAGDSGAPAKPNAPGEGLLDEVLGVKDGSSLLNFGGEPGNGEGKPKAAPKKAPPPAPAPAASANATAAPSSGFAAGFTQGAAPAAETPRVVDAFSLGGEMDATGVDQTERKQKMANTMTWLLVGFNALVIVVLIALLVLNRGKPAESQNPPPPANKDNSATNGNSSKVSGNNTGVASNTNTNTNTTPNNTNPVATLPDATKELTPEEAAKQYSEMLRLWEQAQDAYRRDDLTASLATLMKIRDEYPRKSHPDDLYENIANIQSEIVRRRSVSEDLAKVDEMSALLTSASAMVKANKLQSAIDILTQVRDTFPQRLHPTNLNAEIDKLKKEMERQKNAKFFGQPTG